MQTRDDIVNTMNAEETLSLIQNVLKNGLDEKFTLERPKGVSKFFFSYFFYRNFYNVSKSYNHCYNEFCRVFRKAESLGAPLTVMESFEVIVAYSYHTVHLESKEGDGSFFIAHNLPLCFLENVDRKDFLKVIHNYNLSPYSFGIKSVSSRERFFEEISPCLLLDVDFEIKLNLAGFDFIKFGSDKSLAKENGFLNLFHYTEFLLESAESPHLKASLR